MFATAPATLVALRLPPGPRFDEAMRAAWGRGQAVAPLDHLGGDAATTRALRALRPSTLLEEAGATRLPGAVPVAPDVALVLMTSGTTRSPRAVELTHDALLASAGAVHRRLAARSGDRWLCCLPLGHIAGVAVLLRSGLLDRPAVILERFTPEGVDAATTCNLVSLVPAMLARLLDSSVDLARFKRILVGGGPVSPRLKERAAAAGARVTETYGMTETCGGCVYDGVPLDEVEIVLAQGPRIAIRGPVLMRAYRGMPELTAAALAGGWFHTADRGRLRDGRLEVLGRVDDIISTGGESVDPEDVRALLEEHPLVCEASVFARADDLLGQRVVARVVPVPGGPPPTLEDLRSFVVARAARHNAPRELEIVDRLDGRNGLPADDPG